VVVVAAVGIGIEGAMVDDASVEADVRVGVAAALFTTSGIIFEYGVARE
jgi:hypothetical protein